MGIGLRRLQHLVLWVGNVERSVRFYTEVLGFEVKSRSPNAAFLRIPGTADDHHLGLFEQTGASAPDERAARKLALEIELPRAHRLAVRDRPEDLELEAVRVLGVE